ncbi:hypothetical protein KAR91_88300 [Candidatus Pacearchaeota archaeon]|nr:hypothetical protein [Candidatus Pacearchaeota archaeon]
MDKKQKIDLEPSLLEKEIVRIVENAIKNSRIQLAVDDIKIIAHEVMPDIDRLIANKVAQHFCEIGQFLTDKFKLGD